MKCGEDDLGGVTGAGTGTGTGPEDLEQDCMGWEGWARRGSTAYISMSNILNMSLGFWAGPAPSPQPIEPCTLPETRAEQSPRLGAPSNLIV